MRIRKAHPSEAESLTHLAMQAKAHWGYEAEQLQAWRPTLAVTAEQLQSQPTFVLDEGGSSVFAACDAPMAHANWTISGSSHVHLAGVMGGALSAQALEAAREMGLREILIDADPNAEDFYVR